MDGNTFPSPELLAANEVLLALRRQHIGTQRPICRETPSPGGGQLGAGGDSGRGFEVIPAHLGWGSAALTAVLRRGSCPPPTHTTNSPPLPPPQMETVSRETDVSPASSQAPPPHTLKLYPDIGLAMLRQKATPSGRLWLLLHHLDRVGRGMVPIDLMEQHLTPKSSPLYLCGQRHLRNLLRAGEGVYWTWNKAGVWLYSATRVASSLGVTHLTGRPVALPLEKLLEGIGTFRAHLYAAFHSGRVKQSPQGELAKPISRYTLSKLSGVGRSSQRSYEAQAGVRVQWNVVIGERYNQPRLEERLWQKGKAVFQFTDYRGQQGPVGRQYVAWQIPNSYGAVHSLSPRGRQRRINQALRDLVNIGIPGNGKGEMERTAVKGSATQQRRYYANGKAVFRATGKGERYWRWRSGRVGCAALWQVWSQ